MRSGKLGYTSGALLLAASTSLSPAHLQAQQAAPAGPGSREAVAATSPSGATILPPSEAATKLPDQVFFRGQSATVQMRNSAGLRLQDGMLVLAALVDTSGYSSAVQQKYQGYLITEVPLTIGTTKLAPGEYGVGFLQDNTFVVMDVGAHDLLSAKSIRDEQLRRAMPLQILAAPEQDHFRLYFGRNYVSLQPGK